MRDAALSWETWRSIASFQTVLTGGMATATLLAPRLLLRVFGVRPTPGTVLFFRAFGASLAYVAVAHHGLKNTRDVAAVRTIVLGNLVEDGLLTLLAAHGIARGALGKAGWLLVGAFASEVALNAWLLTRLQEGEPASTGEVRPVGSTVEARA